jgi:hypothetical protein
LSFDYNKEGGDSQIFKLHRTKENILNYTWVDGILYTKVNNEQFLKLISGNREMVLNREHRLKSSSSIIEKPNTNEQKREVLTP